MRQLLGLVFAVLLPALGLADAKSLDDLRREWVVKAFNSRVEEFLEPITLEDVKIKDGVGRADVNKKAKFSYYVYAENPADPRSGITMIPMATSRYAPTYYQTDEWWDAHKSELEEAKRTGSPAPRQDSEEVKKWLKDMKLSTNPLVFKVDADQKVVTQRLQEFLYDFHVTNFTKNGKLLLYRGGEKPTETQDWLKGVRPRGVRYWTPTANYAWRYARKNPSFLSDLIDGKPPIYVFEIPLKDFTALTQEGRYPDLTLGTELTKQAHQNFDSLGVFADNVIAGKDYMGIGRIGVEFEIRSNSNGANTMLKYFKRVIAIDELVADRVQLIKQTTERLIKMRPHEEESLRRDSVKREAQTTLEGKIIYAVQQKLSRETVHSLLRDWEKTGGEGEIANAFAKESFSGLIRNRMNDLSSSAATLSADLKKVNDHFSPRPICRNIFGGDL